MPLWQTRPSARAATLSDPTRKPTAPDEHKRLRRLVTEIANFCNGLRRGFSVGQLCWVEPELLAGPLHHARV